MCLDGKICICLLNAPGAFHDNIMPDYGMYDATESVYGNTDGKVVVHSTFNIGNKEYIIKPAQKDPHNPRSLLNCASMSIQ